MLTDILKESTHLICYGDDAAAVVQQAYRQIPGEEGVLLKGVVSRKKQLIPDLMSTLAERS